MPTEKAHGIQIMKMCEAFASSNLFSRASGFKTSSQNLKIEVELIVPKRLNKIKDDPFEYYETDNVFKITKLPCIDLIPLSGFLGKIAFWIELISFLISAKIYLFSKKFDIFYTREQIAGFFWRNAVLEIHSLPFKKNWIYKKSWRKSRALIVLTKFIKDDLIGIGVPEKKILVAADAVDLNKIDVFFSKEEARQKLDLSKNKILVGYVGMLKTMGMEKGVDVALKSLKLLNGDAFLVLVGGSNEDILFYKKLAENLGLKDRVLFVSRVKHNLISLYLKSFDVLIAPFPSFTHYKFYMSPLKIFEYMASRRPIVASDLPSIREILNDPSTSSGQGNAVLVEPDNPQALARGIKKVLENKVLAEKISNQAFQDVKQYTWEKRAKKILSFFDLWEEEYYEMISRISEKNGKDLKDDKISDYLAEAFSDGWKMLEIGCGSAEISRDIKDNVFYTGVDVSNYALQLARQKTLDKKNVSFFIAEANELPFENNNFDVVLCRFSLEHFKKPAETLIEAERVLKTGGSLIIVSPNLEFPFCFPSALRHKGFSFRIKFYLLRLYDYFARLLGLYHFRVLKDNYLYATGRYEKEDDDLVYLVSSFEVVNFLKKINFSLVFNNELKQSSGNFKQKIRKLITYLPGMKYYGVELFIFVKKNAKL